MRLTQRQQWMLLAGAASAIAAPLTERLVSGAWRGATGESPPVDDIGPRVAWGRVIAWTAASAAIVGIAQVAARRGAAFAWTEMTGERPPRPKRRRSR